ncbi:zinc ABC-transporter zinc-binding protein component [Candidatus Vecturithrix granuli]|uniref:Zinc ABC-transporter zinc-binding protein component n=1 Tax=Vecturithrix granuli TaxID=1499967 RepID=A0A081C5J4_VECG1|nr:zinc ABC-transporter zinc-binding protein component [Candidatus Vecturithrix granuli]
MMKKYIILSLILNVLLLLPLASAAEKVQVLVSIPPQSYFVQRIGGELVDVVSMLPPGAFPHTFEPTAKQMKALSRAELYVRIQVEFEQAWWDKIVAVNPGMYVVDSTQGIDFLEGTAHHHEEGTEAAKDEHEHNGRDPHIWLSPAAVKLQAEAIYQGLIHVDPVHQNTYLINKEQFLVDLETLDQEIRQILAGLKNRTFMVFHPSWAYFARDYQLQQLSIELEGKEPSAADMAQIMKTAQVENIQVIFVQPQTSQRSVEIIARQIGAQVKVLDPLAANWLENMRHVAKTLAESLQQ